MENQEFRSSQPLENGLSEQVVSEVDLLLTLNLSRSALDTLRREKGFPVVKLSLQHRVYLISSVMDWLKQHEARQG